MPTSLASQLAKSASLNAPLLSETARKKHFASSSYLFSANAKGQIDDLDSIFALAINSLAQLKQIYASIAIYDELSTVYQSLFSQKARETDRTLLGREEAEEVNAAITSFMRALGPCLLEVTAGRVIEWLVRRFRIQEFNVKDILALFLPYHESPHFAKMVTILTIDENAPWAFLASYKSAGKPVSRTVLAVEMLKSQDLARFVANLLPEAFGQQGGINVHRTLLCFNTSLLLEFVARANGKDLDASTLAYLLPALLQPLRVEEQDRRVSAANRKDGILGSYVLLAALSQKCAFSTTALKSLVSAMIHSASAMAVVDASQLTTALISVLKPQEPLDSIPQGVVDELIAMPDFNRALSSSLKYAGVEKLLLPLLSHLVASENRAAVELLDFLVTNSRVPGNIVKEIASKLIQNDSRKLLSSLHQRHPERLRKAIEELAEAHGDRAALDQLLMDISMPEGSTGVPRDAILASTDGEPSIRASAVRQIAKLLSGDISNLTEEEILSLKNALLARLYDSSSVVLEALYMELATIVPLVSDANTLKALAESLLNQTTSRPVLRVHLSFLCNGFYEAKPELGLQVLLQIVLPHALFTKSKQKSAMSVWEVVTSSKLSSHKLLKGLKEAVKEVVGGLKDGEKASISAEEMAKTNAAVAKALSENFRASNDYPDLLDWLLTNMESSVDPRTRLLVFLITKELLRSLSGEHQVDAAFSVLHAIEISELGNVGKIDDTDTLNEGAFEDALSEAIVLKPSSRSTLTKAQLSICLLLPSIPRPVNVEIDWFLHDEVDASKDRGARYLYLLRAVYSSVNSVLSSNALASYINHHLFRQLGVDSLLFLAGLWLHASEAIKYVALRHTSAFLRAHSSEAPVDFQTILPALLCALQSSDRRVRDASLECIAILSQASVAAKPSAVYAYERVYGPSSASLQYLDWLDECNYIKSLAERKEHFSSDGNYIIAFHQERLSASKAEGKRDVKQRQRILCYLLSHVTSCHAIALSSSLLRSLCHVSDAIKLQMLLPLIKTRLESQWPIESSPQEEEQMVLSLESFGRSSTKDMNADESKAWSILLLALQKYHAIGKRTPGWNCLLKSLLDGTFASLSYKRQLELSLLLIKMGTSASDVMGIKSLLVKLLKEASLVSALLKSLQPTSAGAGERTAKRQKADVPVAGQEESLPMLTLLAEVLSASDLPGSLDLISVLLDTLARTIGSVVAPQSDLIYVEQLLMTCVESAASQVKEMPNLAPNAIRLDVLVDLMRASENPQTFHQALLLMASLARLAPESVLRNVMPIFTFMGSNVFHRDDSYSFKVIQKTTESIVPVVTASLKEKFSSRLDLFIGAREFLRTFTDAANHIPRHRRTSFFTHLVNVLNPQDFLPPVIMLLADKLSTRISRQDILEAQSTLSLPLSILHHYVVATQITSIRDVLMEAKGLLNAKQNPACEEKTFLEITPDEDQPSSAPMLRKRQCQTLIVLVGCCFKQMFPSPAIQDLDSVVSTIISTLLELALLDENEQTNEDLKEIGSISRWSLLQTLRVISVSSFVKTISSMLSSTNKKVQQGALELLAQRVPLMKADAREEVSLAMVDIVDTIKNCVSSCEDDAFLNESMRALSSIVGSAGPKEESALSAVLPVVLDIAAKRPEVSDAMVTVPALIAKLGPRVIPHLRLVITTCGLILRGDVSFHQESVSGSLRALTASLKTVSGFWGQQELKIIIELYLELDDSATFAPQFEKLVKLVAKTIPSKILMTALFRSWPAVDLLSRPDGRTKFARFFDLLKRCLHFAKRSDVLESLRSLFTNFLDSFGVRNEAPTDIVKLEDEIIAAYVELVVKLNETAFQPLFRRFCDWAFGDETSISRKITFCRTYSALLDLFKELMTPYMHLLLSNFVDLLEEFQKGAESDTELWVASVEMLSKNFSSDDGTFWRDQRLRSVTEPIVQQIPICVDLKPANGKALLSECLTSLVESIDDDALLQSVNRSILMHTRSEDARVRLFALSCAVAVWQTHGRKFSNFGPETATFIMECAEDENDDVVRECHKLKDAVEGEVGKIEGL